jgi:hypothetical protein
MCVCSSVHLLVCVCVRVRVHYLIICMWACVLSESVKSSVVQVIATVRVVGVCWCAAVVHHRSRAVQSMYCGALWCHRWAHESSVLWRLCSESGTCKGCCPLPPVPCACSMAVVTVNCLVQGHVCVAGRRDLQSPVVGLGVGVCAGSCVCCRQPVARGGPLWTWQVRGNL